MKGELCLFVLLASVKWNPRHAHGVVDMGVRRITSKFFALVGFHSGSLHLFLVGVGYLQTAV